MIDFVVISDIEREPYGLKVAAAGDDIFLTIGYRREGDDAAGGSSVAFDAIGTIGVTRAALEAALEATK